VALITSLLLIGLLTAIGLGLTLVGIVETWLSAGARTSQVLSSAADAGAARVEVDLAASSDWTTLLTAASSAPPSLFNDGQAVPMLVDRSVVDLSSETRRIQADSDSLYGSAAVNPDAPAWRLFARGALADLVPGRIVDAPVYLAAWLADDPADGDANPAADLNGRVLVRAIAYGIGGAKRSVEATVARVGPIGFAGRPSAIQIVSWRELR
jgi:hypothetical protein